MCRKNLLLTYDAAYDGLDTTLTTGTTYTPVEADIASYLIVVATTTLAGTDKEITVTAAL